MFNALSSIFFILYRVELMPIKFGGISYSITENANEITLTFANGGIYFSPIWDDEFFRGLALPDITAGGLTHVLRDTLTRFDPNNPTVKMTKAGALFYNESALAASIVIPKASELIIFI